VVSRGFPGALATLSLLCAWPAAGQEDAGTDPLTRAAEVAERVHGVRLEPDPVVVQLGDTLEVRGVAVDSAGVVVEGAVWGATDGQVFELEPIAADRSAQVFRLWGHEVGDGVIGLFVATPDGAGEPRWRRVGGAAVSVLDYPVVELAIDPLPFAPYAGTSISLSGTAYNAIGIEHALAVIEWSTSDTSVAVVDEGGRLALLRTGSVDLIATAGSVTRTASVEVGLNPVTSVELPVPPSRVRTGDVVSLAATLRDGDGRLVEDAAVAYLVEPTVPGRGRAQADAHGAFVAEVAGRFRVIAVVGEAQSGVEVEVFPRQVSRTASLVAHLPTVRATDLWVFPGLDGRDYAYIGTLTNATMYAIDVTDPANPLMTDSVTVDGRRVNDVKINDARTLAIITSENASNRLNGITILDIADPAHPSVVTHYTTNLTGGVHNVWFVGDLVYAVNDGTLDVHIIDVSVPATPVEVGRWGLDRRGRYLHDVSVMDGLAYLSYWNDGVVILDVGAGIKGGTPVTPQFVSSFKYRYDVNGEQFGNTHHAIRYGDYLFLGDEIFGCPGCAGPRGTTSSTWRTTRGGYGSWMCPWSAGATSLPRGGRWRRSKRVRRAAPCPGGPSRTRGTCSCPT